MENQTLPTNDRRRFLQNGLLAGSAGAATGLLRSTNALASPPPAQTDEVFLNVTDYGATGDGATDDKPAFQAAIDALIANGGGTLFIPRPSAQYIWKSPVKIINGMGIHILGEGLLDTGDPNKFMIRFAPDPDNVLESDLTDPLDIHAALEIKGCSFCSVANFSLYINKKADVGFWVTGSDQLLAGGQRSVQNTFKNMKVVSANRVGLLYGHPPANPQSPENNSEINTTSFLNSRFPSGETDPNTISPDDDPNLSGIICMGANSYAEFMNVEATGDVGFEIFDGGYDLYFCYTNNPTVAGVMVRNVNHQGLNMIGHYMESNSQGRLPDGSLDPNKPAHLGYIFRSTESASYEPRSVQIIGGLFLTPDKEEEINGEIVTSPGNGMRFSNNMNMTLIGNSATQGWVSDWYNGGGTTPAAFGTVLDLNNSWKRQPSYDEYVYPVLTFGGYFDNPTATNVYYGSNPLSRINTLTLSDSTTYQTQYIPSLGINASVYSLADRYASHYVALTSNNDRVVALPKARRGKRFTFTRTASGELVIQPQSTDVIQPGGTLGQLLEENTGIGSSVTLYCSADGFWTIEAQFGTWNFL